MKVCIWLLLKKSAEKFWEDTVKKAQKSVKELADGLTKVNNEIASPKKKLKEKQTQTCNNGIKKLNFVGKVNNFIGIKLFSNENLKCTA